MGAVLGWLLAHAAGPPQNANCKAYVTCFEATGGTKGTLDSSYGPMGSCWTAAPERAQSCDDACVEAQNALIADFPDAGCQPLKKHVLYPQGC